MARRKTHRTARRAYGFARRRVKHAGGWKPIVSKISIGIGVAALTSVILGKVGVNIPYVKYVPAFMLGGPIGAAGALGYDALNGTLAIPGLGGAASSGGVVI